MSTGTLIVQTRAARGALPVAGAAITVYCPDTGGVPQPCVSERTGLSGATVPIRLSASSLAGTSPEAVPPFAAYRVDIDHPDYRPMTVRGVAIFSDLTTTLPVLLTPPLTVGEQSERIVVDSAETGPTGSGVR
ncbi:MAG TPA: hypothetical protein IAA32_03450 [Candidatus Butyricicoccus stercorigallinarum]|nr:hypothetical protein [Candidatus Butyricicoccus stercorigallinarum]